MIKINRFKGLEVIAVFIFLFSFFRCSSQENLKKESLNTGGLNHSQVYEKGIEYYLRSTPKNYYKALNQFRLSRKKKPSPEGYAMLSLTYSRLGQHLFLKKKKKNAFRAYKRAFRYAILSLKLKADLSLGYTALALYARQIQNKKILINMAKKSIKLNPDNFEAYSLLGDAYNPVFFKKKPQYKKSIALYHKSLTLSPKFISPRYNLALLYFYKKFYKKSIQELSHCISMNPYFPAFYYYLALNYNKTHRYNEALRSINQAVKLASMNPYYIDLKGQIYFKMKKMEKAELHFKKAIDIKRDSAPFYYHLSLVSHYNRKDILSIKLCQKAIKLNPKYNLPHYQIALILDKKKKYRYALKKYLDYLHLTFSGIDKKEVRKRVRYIRKLLKASSSRKGTSLK